MLCYLDTVLQQDQQLKPSSCLPYLTSTRSLGSECCLPYLTSTRSLGSDAVMAPPNSGVISESWTSITSAIVSVSMKLYPLRTQKKKCNYGEVRVKLVLGQAELGRPVFGNLVH